MEVIYYNILCLHSRNNFHHSKNRFCDLDGFSEQPILHRDNSDHNYACNNHSDSFLFFWRVLNPPAFSYVILIFAHKFSQCPKSNANQGKMAAERIIFPNVIRSPHNKSPIQINNKCNSPGHDQLEQRRQQHPPGTARFFTDCRQCRSTGNIKKAKNHQAKRI